MKAELLTERKEGTAPCACRCCKKKGDLKREELLQHILADPASFARQRHSPDGMHGFEIIALPGEPLQSEPLQGDILIRLIEGGSGHASVVASPGLWYVEDLPIRGLQADAESAEGFVHVSERAPLPRDSAEGYARGVVDRTGHLLEDLLLLRLATPTAPTIVNVPQQPAAEPPATVTVTPTVTDDAPVEDEVACDHMDAARLSWAGASLQQLDLMRRVYLRQVTSACQSHAYVADVADAELSAIENGQRARQAAAASCRVLLAAARSALSNDPAAASVSGIGIVSGYRSATRQMENWNRNFPRYASETQTDRAGLAGGEFGDAAAALLTRYISRRLAAPGFSLHNDGRAIDFSTVQSGKAMGADTSAQSRANWRASWFFSWLTNNANGYGFYQNTSIDEPWHWEFRGPAAATQSEDAPDTVEPTDSGENIAPELTISAGRLELSNTPLLSSHKGTQPDLILRWNDMQDPNAVDVVIHFHGYSSDRESMSLRRKEPYSGLDFANPANPADPRTGRSAATLCILPRGSYTGDAPKANPERYSFPALTGSTGITDLVSYSMGQFQTATNASASLASRRLIITAHSGGGAPLMQVLAYANPDEIQVFDALYGDASALIAWLNARIAAEIQSWTSGKTHADSGLCVIYRPKGTGTQSLRVQQAIKQAIGNAPSDAQPVLQAAYRVLKTAVAHGEIPRRFGWQLLADIAAPFVASASSGGVESLDAEDAAPQTTPAVPPGSACAYFFKGSRYLRYNIATDAVDVGPAQVAENWKNLPQEFQSNLDAAVNWGDGHAYFFKGARYVRYNIAIDRVDVGPVEIAANWRNLPPEFQSSLDAAVNWGNGNAYFFKGSRYVRYNIPGDTIDVGPVEIAANWTALPPEFQSKLDAVVNWGNGNAYFFKRARYVRYNIASDTIDVGPTEIARNWTNLPGEFQSGIRAAINWTFPGDLADLMRAAGLTVNEVGDWRSRHRPGVFAPIGVMMHHTAGTASLDGILKGRTTVVKGKQEFLPGPLANFHVEKSGAINIVSDGNANHAGPGSRRVLDEVSQGIAPSGTAAQRGLTDAIGGNRFFYGFENENKGDGIDPWPEAQLDAMARAAAALCRRHCWSSDRVIAHKEWTSRKPDPTFDMNDFRARVARLF